MKKDFTPLNPEALSNESDWIFNTRLRLNAAENTLRERVLDAIVTLVHTNEDKPIQFECMYIVAYEFTGDNKKTAIDGLYANIIGYNSNDDLCIGNDEDEEDDYIHLDNIDTTQLIDLYEAMYNAVI